MTTGLPWFRMYNDIIDDEIVTLLSFEDRWHFVALSALSHSGVLDKRYSSQELRERVIANKLEIDLEKLSVLTASLVELGLVDEYYKPFPKDEYLRPPSHEWRIIRDRIFLRDDYTCSYCGSRGVRLECDHITPVSKGGSHNDENLTTSCISCNRSKGAKTLEEWRVSH